MKRFLATVVAVMVARSAGATTYYVRTTGNNGNTGLTNDDAHAWATLNYALLITPTTGGPHTICLNTGAYVEPTDLRLQESYGTLTTVKPTTGAKDVWIGCATGHSFYQANAIANLLFTNLIFTNMTPSYNVFGSQNFASYTASNISFSSCLFSNLADATGVALAVGGGGCPAQRYQFNNCTFYSTASGYSGLSLSARATNVVCGASNCVFVGYYGASAQAGTVNLTNGSYYGSSISLSVGIDGRTGNPVTGNVFGGTVYPAPHSMLIGAGATNVLAANVAIASQLDLALVLKGNRPAVPSYAEG